MAPRPVPVGWEQLPVTDGNFSAESTKAKAPAAAMLRRAWGFSAKSLLNRTAPVTTKGAEMAYQATQCAAGR